MNVHIPTFPTEGNPIKATLASPDFITSKPSPCKKSRYITNIYSYPCKCFKERGREREREGGGLDGEEKITLAADFPPGSSNCCLYFASFALSKPRWYSVAVSKKREENYRITSYINIPFVTALYNYHRITILLSNIFLRYNIELLHVHFFDYHFYT